MKKGDLKIIVVALIMIYSFSIMVSAEPCNLQISMINQDPYPAIQGDYVKVMFKIDGVRNAECGTVTFGVKETYPISLDPNSNNKVTIDSGIYQKDYPSYYLAPYKLRVDPNALDGENPIEIFYSTRTVSNVIKEFKIKVEDIRADFEIHVKDYSYLTKKLRFEILNTAKSDIKALTIEIPKQSGVEIKGTNRVIVGDLDSNEYTSAEFEATLPEGKTTINLNVLYTDLINTRRELQKVVEFDSSYYVNRNGDSKTFPYWILISVGVVIILIIWNRVKKKRREAERKKRRLAA